MGEETTVYGRFPGTHLDPKAQEFRPASNPCPNTQIALFTPHIYFPYPHPHHFIYDVPASTTTPPFPPPPPPEPAYRGGPPPRATAAATRAVVLSMVPAQATGEGVRRELEVFGEVRGVEMGRLPEGIVAVHFYDVRGAEAAVAAIQERHMEQQSRLRHQHYCGLVMAPVVGPGFVAGRAVWAYFVMPETAPVPVPDGFNQGTIVVFNLDANVPVVKLKKIFEAYGQVKEMRETPLKRQQRFVEFFDVRDAARAVVEMDGKEINGKSVVVDFSRPGGHRRRFSSSFNSTWNNNSSSSSSCHYPIISIDQQQPPPSFNVAKSYRRSSSSASSSSTSTSSQPQNTSKKNTSTSTLTSPTWNNNNNNSNRRWSNNNHRSSMASLSINDGNYQEKVTSPSSSKKVINTNNSPSSVMKSQQHHGWMKQSKSRSWKGSGNGRQKGLLESHFLMNKEAMVDTRTTVMIKNIPNKYSQKLLLNMLDNHCIHCNEQIADGGGGDDDHLPMSSYDFVYLPIDFNNKCNVGYGFVNMTSPEAAWRLYQAFHMQHWEVFNSRKICEITYARLQGLEALKEHFKNSKFACETDEYLPVVFTPPRDGRHLTDPVPIGGHADAVTLKPMHAHDGVDGHEHEQLLMGSGNSSSTSSETHDQLIS